MVHNRSPSLYTTLEASSNEDGATSGVGGSSGSPGLRGCNMVTPTDPITTTPVSENSPALQTTPTVVVRTAVLQLGMEFLLDQQQAYQEEQEV
jgi:hypothetical protein